MLITTAGVDARNSLWNFLRPFNLWLWLLICGMLVTNTFFYWAVERIDADDNSKKIGLFDSFYIMWCALTGGGGPKPRKTSTKLLNMGYYFFILIIVATYTANMASFLILRTDTRLSSMTDAVNNRAHICAIHASSAATVLTTYYPTISVVTNPNYKAADNLPNLFQMMRDGMCEGTVATMIDWQTWQVRAEANANCDLVLVDTFREYSGALPYLLDYVTYCSSLLEAVMTNLIVGMKATGQLDQIRDNYLHTNWANVVCATSTTSISSNQMTLVNMAGVVLVYMIFVGAAFIHVILEKVYKYTKKRRFQQKDSSLQSSDGTIVDHYVKASKELDIESDGNEDEYASAVDVEIEGDQLSSWGNNELYPVNISTSRISVSEYGSKQDKLPSVSLRPSTSPGKW